MAKKGGMPTYTTVDDYINAQKEEAQPLLRQLRALIHEAVPDVIELENKKVPTFIVNNQAKSKQQLMISSYAKYVSFYPFEETVEAFKDKLTDYDLGKGTVKFPFDQSLPEELIKEMVKYRKKAID